MPTFKDLSGQKYNGTTVISFIEMRKSYSFWKCRCDHCGKEFERSIAHVRNRKCLCRSSARTHGESWKEKKTIEYKSWRCMKSRCELKNNASYFLYGKRGIKICERWQDYSKFLLDMGRKPTPKHSIDRINNDGNYEPGNCRWATPKEQSRNNRRTRLVKFRGRELCIVDWAKLLNVSNQTMKYRMDNWPVARALTKRGNYDAKSKACH